MATKFRLRHVGAGPSQAVFVCDNPITLLGKDVEIVDAQDYNKLVAAISEAKFAIACGGAASLVIQRVSAALEIDL